MLSVSAGAARGVKTRLNSQPSAGLSLKLHDLAVSVAAGRQNHRSLASGKENDKRKIPPKAKREDGQCVCCQPPQFCGLSFSFVPVSVLRWERP